MSEEIIKKESTKDKTLLDLVSDYVELRKGYLAIYTVNDYKARIINRMKTLATKPVKELSKDDIVNWWKACPKSRSDVVALVVACSQVNGGKSGATAMWLRQADLDRLETNDPSTYIASRICLLVCSM